MTISESIDLEAEHFPRLSVGFMFVFGIVLLLSNDRIRLVFDIVLLLSNLLSHMIGLAGIGFHVIVLQ